jgi:hypothetical protein
MESSKLLFLELSEDSGDFWPMLNALHLDISVISDNLDSYSLFWRFEWLFKQIRCDSLAKKWTQRCKPNLARPKFWRLALQSLQKIWIRPKSALIQAWTALRNIGFRVTLICSQLHIFYTKSDITRYYAKVCGKIYFFYAGSLVWNAKENDFLTGKFPNSGKNFRTCIIP